MSFEKILERLHLAVDEVQAQDRCIEVSARDLWALLREHARLDADARLIYRPNLDRARKALDAHQAAATELAHALRELPSQAELLKRVLSRSEWKP
jgi:hypothetical protein